MMTEVLDEVADECAPPRVELGPRTERLGRDGTLVIPASGLEMLADAVEEALGGALGERAEPFYGHLTVARLRRNTALPEGLLGVPFDAVFVAQEFVLIESRPGSEGSIYTIRHRRMLGES